MIRLLKWSLLAAIATVVFVITGALGFVIGQVKYLTMRGSKGYIRYLIDMINGVFTGASYIIEGYALGIDITANGAGGEGLEWLLTKNRKQDTITLMGSPDATISAGIGDMKAKGFLNSRFGRMINKALNISFNQKDHGAYALQYYKARKKIRASMEPFFKKRKK